MKCKSKKTAMSKERAELQVITHWRPIKGKPSPIWFRLWGKLLANKKGKVAGIGEATRDGECKDAEERDI
ncbi:hypothetical protein ES703_68806 [subsurface metagenome]